MFERNQSKVICDTEMLKSCKYRMGVIYLQYAHFCSVIFEHSVCHLSIYLSIYLSICLSIYLYTYIYIFKYLFMYFFIPIFILYIHIFIYFLNQFSIFVKMVKWLILKRISILSILIRLAELLLKLVFCIKRRTLFSFPIKVLFTFQNQL